MPERGCGSNFARGTVADIYAPFAYAAPSTRFVQPPSPPVGGLVGEVGAESMIVLAMKITPLR